ncbi:MAG TPA: 1,4-dihydroxy-2-naphthoate polyprenyltransferase [Acidimicrobiales bacterium]|nr:1,4-dihydroxy-2-naphthoate polyprenyltransferase [Acidimicrobiales bacterium]
MSPPLKVWIAGARPRTLPAAVVPVFVGTAAGYWSSGRLLVDPTCRSSISRCTSLDHQVSWPNALLALIVALAIQIGTNYVNDYADGQRGTDERRAGPLRLVAGGLATVREVKIAAAASFAVAAVAGLILAARVTWWFIPLGIICFVAGWAYTGGPRPYGYYGFGELFVFVFFGLVATAGSAYVQHAPFLWNSVFGPISVPFDWGLALWAGVPVGLLAAALLQANNLRDIDTDTAAGKRTLAVRLGRRRAGLLYCYTLMGVALAIGLLYRSHPWALLALLAAPLTILPVRLALSERNGRALLPMLGATARLQIAVGALLTIGLLV